MLGALLAGYPLGGRTINVYESLLYRKSKITKKMREQIRKENEHYDQCPRCRYKSHIDGNMGNPNILGKAYR